MGIIFTLIFLPVTIVIACFLLLFHSSKKYTTVKSANINATNVVGNQTQDELARANMGCDFNEKKILPYDIEYLNYKREVDKFLKKHFENVSSWTFRSPQTILQDNFHIITIIFKNGESKKVQIVPISGIGHLNFTFYDQNKDTPIEDTELSDTEKNHIDEEKNSDDNKVSAVEEEKSATDESSDGNENSTEIVESPNDTISPEKEWLEKNLEYLLSEAKKAENEDADFFVIEKDKTPPETCDLIILSELIISHGLLLGVEDGTYMINV